MSSLTKGTVRIQVRKDTAANWTSANPVLGNGEFGLESDVGNYKLKIGTGTIAWTSLGYLGHFKILDGDGTSLNLYQGRTWTLTEGAGISIDHDDVSGDEVGTTITCDLEGTEVKSTGEAIGRFLRADGPGTSSWNVPPFPQGTSVLSTGEAVGKVLKTDGDDSCSWASTLTMPVDGTSILSTGETGTAKFLRVDGDDSCSWQTPPTGGSPEGTAVLSTGVADGYVLTADGADGAAWEESISSGGITTGKSIAMAMIFG